MIDITLYDDEGEEIIHSLPSKRVVCYDCNGERYVLNSSMRYHAYTQEEFEQEFDDEMEKEYFTRGGIYDVVCSTCKGKNVIDIIDEDACVNDDRYKDIYRKYEEYLEDQHTYEAECAAERRWCGEY